MVRPCTWLLAAMALLHSPAFAQQSPPDTSRVDRAGSRSAEIWAGYSPGSTSAGFLGRHAGITLGLVGMRWNRRVSASESRSVSYAIDLIPVAQVTPLIVYTGNAASRCRAPKFDCQRIPAIARGIGVNPLGVTAMYGAHRTVQWRFGANGGVLLFDRPTPSDLSSQLNFTATLEGGVQLVNRRGSGVVFVYRLHHLSNGGRGNDNLAMLSHVISIGARWRLAR